MKLMLGIGKRTTGDSRITLLRFESGRWEYREGWKVSLSLHRRLFMWRRQYREIERLRADNLALRMALRGMVDTADRVDLDRPTFGECKAMRDARAALVAVDG